MKPDVYHIAEIFLSPQGEGVRAGTLNVFVRFAGCNLTCRAESEGFDCDTQFSGGRPLTRDELLAEMAEVGGKCKNVILTGGEPGLQVNSALLDALRVAGWYVAIETNGTRALPPLGIDWVCVSPKTAEHTLRYNGRADEVKYVIHHGQALPKPSIEADHYLISPAFQPEGYILKKDLEWCLKLLKENPEWRISIQTHKLLNVR